MFGQGVRVDTTVENPRCGRLACRDTIAARRASKGVSISTSLTPSPASDSYATGTFPGAGTYFCLECGSQLALHEDERLPECPRCGASIFRLDSIFESMQEHGGTTEYDVPAETDEPGWLNGVREELVPGVRRLAYRDDDRTHVLPIRPGWTRIGRSVAADVRLDDPSVSRRHALIVSEADQSLRVLDDRSLNGVFVNGELVEWGKLRDGDELTVGRYHLFVLEG
jgi:FHA domain/Zinc-ribbon containing domain